MQIADDIVYLVICFGVSSFFGAISLVTVFVTCYKQESKINDAINNRIPNAVSISGKGNIYNDKKTAHPD